MNFKKCVLMVMFLAIGMFFMVSSAQAGVTLSENVEAGMELEDVEKHLKLDYHMSDKGLVAYQRGEKAVYYFFNGKTDELIYKLMIMEGNKAKYMDKYREMSDTTIEDNGAVFYSKNDSDFGIKIMDEDTTDDQWQLWMGSIKLWDDYAEHHSFMNLFRK